MLKVSISLLIPLFVTRALCTPWIPFNPPLLPARPRLAESCGAPTVFTPLDPSRAHTRFVPHRVLVLSRMRTGGAWDTLLGMCTISRSFSTPFSFHETPFFHPFTLAVLDMYVPYTTLNAHGGPHTHTSSTPVVARPHARNARMTKKTRNCPTTSYLPRARNQQFLLVWSPLLASSASSPLEVS